MSRRIYVVHIASEPSYQGVQYCRRCESCDLALTKLTSWPVGCFVVEELTWVWNQLGTGGGYKRLEIWEISEAEVMSLDRYAFCMSKIEQERWRQAEAAKTLTRITTNKYDRNKVNRKKVW